MHIPLATNCGAVGQPSFIRGVFGAMAPNICYEDLFMRNCRAFCCGAPTVFVNVWQHCLVRQHRTLTSICRFPHARAGVCRLMIRATNTMPSSSTALANELPRQYPGHAERRRKGFERHHAVCPGGWVFLGFGRSSLVWRGARAGAASGAKNCGRKNAPFVHAIPIPTP
jgi:hypothetical protein